jgi:hypothetical protein
MYLFFGDAVTIGLGMKKVDQIRDLLMQEYTPRQVAERVLCSLSLVYEVRGKSDLASLQKLYQLPGYGDKKPVQIVGSEASFAR